MDMQKKKKRNEHDPIAMWRLEMHNNNNTRCKCMWSDCNPITRNTFSARLKGGLCCLFFVFIKLCKVCYLLDIYVVHKKSGIWQEMSQFKFTSAFPKFGFLKLGVLRC